MTLTPEQATFYAGAIAATAALIGILIRGTVDWRLMKRQLVQQRELLTEQLDQQRQASAAQLESQERIADAARVEQRAMLTEQLEQQQRASLLQIESQARIAEAARVEQRETLADQLEQQRQAAREQIESQERIAAAARAEQRSRTMLNERRAIYERVLEHARHLGALIIHQLAAMQDLAKVDLRQTIQDWEAAKKEKRPQERWSDDALTYELACKNRLEIAQLIEQMELDAASLELVAPKPIASVVVAMADWAHVVNPKTVDVQRAADAYNAHRDSVTEFLRLCRLDIEGTLDGSSSDPWA